MAAVLADPSLYRFTGGEPPTEAELESRYRRWAEGSPRVGERWHNWVVRLRDGGPAIGHVQATIADHGTEAEIAWTIGTPWQGHGYATEAARALVAWLEAAGVLAIAAHIHPDHAASRGTARHAGLVPTDEIVDGEGVWRTRRRT